MIFKNKNFKKGMTYIELIVVISIFTIMSGVALYNQRGFQEQVNVNNLSQDIALEIVGQQKNAMFGKLPGTLDPSWKPSYGVYFDNSDVAHSNKFILYTDTDVDPFKTYSGNDCLVTNDLTVDECTDVVSLSKAHISAMCVEVVGGVPNCVTGGANNHVNSNIQVLAFNFTRPESSALILQNNIPFDPNVDIAIDKAYIEISSDTNSSISKIIEIDSSGRIFVQQ